MIHLYNSATDEYIGVITEKQFEFIQADLEEESIEDQDYYINQVTVDWMESQGADHELGALRRDAGGESEEMATHWHTQ